MVFEELSKIVSPNIVRKIDRKLFEKQIDKARKKYPEGFVGNSLRKILYENLGLFLSSDRHREAPVASPPFLCPIFVIPLKASWKPLKMLNPSTLKI